MKKLEPRITENGIAKNEKPHYGKYVSMRLKYIKEHKKDLFSLLRIE